MTKVSIGLPVYNGEAFLDEAMNSLVNQTFDEFEIIISDNGSTDRTEEICRRWAEADDRVRYLRSGENRGAAWNFNNVFDHAKGTYFHWAAHDDLLEPEFIAECVAVLDSRPDVVLVYSRIRWIDEKGADLGPWSEYSDVTSGNKTTRLRAALRDWWCYPVFGLIRADALRETGLIGPFHASDRLLLGELSILGKFHCIDRTLFIHRQHSGMSAFSHHGPYQRGAWWDPNSASASRWPHWLYYLHVLRMIRRSPLSGLERLRAAADTAVLMAGEWKQLLFDIYRPFRNRFTKKQPY